MNNEQYTKQLKDFNSYLEKCFTVLMEYGNKDDIDSFYNSDFTIEFRGKKVTLANGADVFQAIEEIINGEIDENEEANEND